MTLTLSLLVQQSSGLWLDLNDQSNFRVGANSFESYAQQWRRVMVTSPYMEGQYQIHAVPDNGVESLEIYCMGATYSQAMANARLAISAFSQPAYKVNRIISGEDQMWSCYAAEYAVKTSNVLASSNMLILSLSIPRLPSYTTNVDPAMMDLDGGTPTSVYEGDVTAGGV